MSNVILRCWILNSILTEYKGIIVNWSYVAASFLTIKDRYVLKIV